MKELESLYTCKPALSTNGGRYFIEVQLLWKFNFRNDRGKKIYIIQWYLQNRFVPSRLTKNGTMIEFVFQTANIYAKNNCMNSTVHRRMKTKDSLSEYCI